MITLKIKSPHEMAIEIGQKAQQKRLSLNLSQQTLSQKSGVCYGTLKKFERTGQISLTSLLKIALALDALDNFEALFTQDKNTLPASLDELLNAQTRQRGRK